MTRWTRTVAAAAVALLAGTAAAQDGDADRLRRLEEELARQRANQEAMRAELEQMRAERDAWAERSGRGTIFSAVDAIVSSEPDPYGGASYVGPGFVRRPGSSITFGGYFSTRYESSEEDGAFGKFVDMRLVPQFHADISEWVDFDTEVEIEHAGVGGPADGEIVVEYAELSFSCADEFAFKVGTLLVPFGRFNLAHDDPINELASRPTVARYVVPSAFDLPGVGVDGVVELGDDLSFNYDVILTNGFRDMFDSENGSRPARGLFDSEENHGKTVFGRVGIVPTVPVLDALDLGASFAYGHVGSDDGRGPDDLHGYGFDAAAKWGPWEFMSEYDRFSINRKEPVAPVLGGGMDPGPVRGLYGYYYQVLHRFRGDWVQSLPYAEESASVAVVFRKDFVDLHDRAHGASKRDDEHGWTIGLNYRPTTKTVVKVEYRKARSGAPGELGEDRDLFVVEFATYF